MKIDIVIPCGPKAETYVPYVINNLVKTATTHDLKFILMEHRSNVSMLEGHPNVRKIVHMADDIPDSTHSASEAHARSVNTGVQFIETEISMIMDYDIVFLTKGWDRWMVGQFDDPQVGVVGTEYKDSMRGARKYLDYPTIIMCMLRSDLIHKYKLNFAPKHNPVNITSQELAYAYGRPLGFQVQPDSGYEIATKLRPAGIKGVTLKYIHENGVLPIGQNFHESGVRANHMKSGSIQKQETIDDWMRRVDEYIEKQNETL